MLAEHPFGLTLVSGGPDCARRDVRGAHAVEVDEPARWLARDWVMLTTGVRLRGNARAQRALVPALEEAGVCALGFGVGLGFKQRAGRAGEGRPRALLPRVRGAVRHAVP